MSQYGFQLSYDSQTQMELGIDGNNVNPTSVQGWNGVAIHRKDQAQSVDTLTIQMLSLQMEEDIPILNTDLDLISFATQDEEFAGRWTISSFTNLVTIDSDELFIIADRYMPKWKHDKEERWDNDYRWSPDSPAIQAKLYQRAVPDSSNGVGEIKWHNLASFTVNNAMT